MVLEDWLLGDSFMQNVYTLYDYGNDTDSSDQPSYMQFLSVSTYAASALDASDYEFSNRS